MQTRLAAQRIKEAAQNRDAVLQLVNRLGISDPPESIHQLHFKSLDLSGIQLSAGVRRSNLMNVDVSAHAAPESAANMAAAIAEAECLMAHLNLPPGGLCGIGQPDIDRADPEDGDHSRLLASRLARHRSARCGHGAGHTRRPATGTVCWGVKSAPLSTHHVPETTTQMRSVL